jgi:hypothetical protein
VDVGLTFILTISPAKSDRENKTLISNGIRCSGVKECKNRNIPESLFNDWNNIRFLVRQSFRNLLFQALSVKQDIPQVDKK